VLDLGCGPGEHCRFLAGKGFRVVGVDRSETMLKQARQSPVPEQVTFICSDIVQLESSVTGRYGAVISLGNTLAGITREEEIRSLFHQVAVKLLPGGIFLFQILNYEKIRTQDVRNLPLNFIQEDSGGETIFLRLMKYHDDGMVDFCPTILAYDPGRNPPLTIVQSRLIRLRGWTRPQLQPMLEDIEFKVTCYGSIKPSPYRAADSPNLVIVAERH